MEGADRIIQQLSEYLEGSRQFVLQQAPDVIAQKLHYAIVSNWIGLFLCLLFCVLSIVAGYYFWRYPIYDKYESLSLFSMLGRLFSIVALVWAITPLLICMSDLIKIYVAPKVYLLEWLIDLKG